MKISEIFSKFQQTKMLQLHQLRVAAVGYLIMQEIDPGNQDVIKALAVHDLGNIVRIKLSLSPKDLEPEGVPYWQNVQDKMIEKYGKNDHTAHMQMLKEIGAAQNIVEMVHSINWEQIEAAVASDDMILKVVNYSDMRVGPFGILPAIERIDEVNKRKDSWPEYAMIRRLIVTLEQQIFSGLKLKPEDINDVSVNKIIPLLGDLDIPTAA